MTVAAPQSPSLAVRARGSLKRLSNRIRRLFLGCQWTPRAGQVAALSRKVAAAMQHDQVNETHFTIALGRLGEGFGPKRLRELGFDYERALQQGRAILGPGRAALNAREIPFSPAAKNIIAIAQDLSARDDLYYFGVDHILFALLRQREPLLLQLLAAKGIDPAEYESVLEKDYRAAQRSV